jgi:hypothetical protein
MRSQPANGRYFPIEPPRFVALTHDWSLGGGVGAAPRYLRNLRDTELASQRLALLRPGLDVTLYSLPNAIERELGEQAVTKALQMLARWKADPPEMRTDHSRQIVVFLEDCSRLRVLDERLRFGRRKFGAGEGLSSSRKPQVTSRNVTEVAVLSLE